MAQEKQRFIYIDLLRGWAVLVMIEVHVVNAFLLPELRMPDWFKVLNFINGLVAPSFLFVSGFSFVLVAQRKWNDYLNRTPVFRRQAGRIAQILAVGYLLHLPFFSFRRLMQMRWTEWGAFWEIDVLHAIAVSLFVMVFFILITRERKKNFLLLAAFSVIVIFVSPLLYNKNLDYIFPEPIGNYFTAAHHSQFPLFPWMGFVLCGGVASQMLVWWKETLTEQKIFRNFFFIGVFMIAVALVVSALPVAVYPEHNYWRANPSFFFIRLGIVVMLLSSLWYWEKKFQSGKSIVSIVGAESLVAYAGHLLVIYGQFFNSHSLSFLVGKTKTYSEVAVMTIVLVAATVIASYLWHRIKNWSMFYARVLMYSIVIVAAFVFFTNSY